MLYDISLLPIQNQHIVYGDVEGLHVARWAVGDIAHREWLDSC